MFRLLLHLLPGLACCLPVLAGMPAGIVLGEKEKEVHKRVVESDDFAPLNDRAKRRLETNFILKEKLGGQQWGARFEFDRSSKMLTQLLFVGEKAMQPNQYNKLLKSFYIFTLGHLRTHFKLQEPLNTPEFGHASGLKAEEMFPLHASRGEGIMLVTGLWKDKQGGIHLCFSVQPTSNSAMGQTYTSNTSGKEADWMDVPDFASTDEGKAFLEETGMAPAPPPPAPAEEEPQEEEEEEEEDTLPEEEDNTVTEASTDLPQAEQDILNALMLFERGKHKEGLAKLITAAQAGNARALYELGCSYAEGKHTLMPNHELSENAFRRAALSGYALAMVRYGAEFPVALSELSFRAEDGKKIVEVAESAGASSPTGRFNHAIMLRYGYGVRKDVQKAISIMQQLATEGDPEAARLAQEWAQ